MSDALNLCSAKFTWNGNSVHCHSGGVLKCNVSSGGVGDDDSDKTNKDNTGRQVYRRALSSYNLSLIHQLCIR